MVRIAFFSVPIWDEEIRWLELRHFLTRTHTRDGWREHRKALRFIIEKDMVYHFEWEDRLRSMSRQHFRNVAIVEYILCFYHLHEAALFRLFFSDYRLLLVEPPFDDEVDAD